MLKDFNYISLKSKFTTSEEKDNKLFRYHINEATRTTLISLYLRNQKQIKLFPAIHVTQQNIKLDAIRYYFNRIHTHTLDKIQK